ncbi:MAG: asparagine synthase (glutamine-hydrolyzing) [Bacillota bacterium]
MCGIAGWISWEKDLTSNENKKILAAMQDTLKRRGPDEKGEWITKDVALLHRRLIVIDPEGGKQPMVKQIAGNKFIISYNGELYNTVELRKQLKKIGYHFNSHSDTEVLLTSYLEWGVECVEYLNGIYAFAVWDQKRGQLFLTRDRMGVKPLFYSCKPDDFYFGSELKSLLAHPEIEAVVGKDGLAEIFALGPARTPGQGIFEGIKELKPGHYLIYNRTGIEIKKYWSLQSRKHLEPFSETVQTIKKLFVDTVQRQLISDMPICTLLSGGLDSSAITAVASKKLEQEYNYQLHTYAVDYQDNHQHFKSSEFQPSRDQQWIDIMSDYSTTKHHNVILTTNQLISALQEGVYARDLPGMADIDVSLYLFCSQIAQNFTVAVSGECADEIFAGYPWFHKKGVLDKEIFPWLRNIEFRTNVLNNDLRKSIEPQQYLKQRYQEALSEVPRLANDTEIGKRMREITYLTLTRWMPVLLERKDRMSMYTGLEVRVPFCDHRLVEYVWNVPWEMKNYGGQRKGVLRKAVAGLLPEEIRTRPKNPYPKTVNPSYLEAVTNLLLEIINNNNAPLIDFVNSQEIKKIIELRTESNVPWFGQLMQIPQWFAYLIQVNFWLEDYGVRVKTK